MNAKKIKEIVDDYHSWRGNSYTLAALIADAAKQDAASVASDAGHEDVAQLILES